MVVRRRLVAAILVPYDGSQPAQKAVEHAVRTVEGDEIILLRVIEVADGMLEAGLDIVQERLQEHESGTLPAALKELLAEADIEFRVETVVGKPAREIVAFAEEQDVSQIVVGSHGREGVSRVLLGSVAETVVRRAPMTVTVVR